MDVVVVAREHGSSRCRSGLMRVRDCRGGLGKAHWPLWGAEGQGYAVVAELGMGSQDSKIQTKILVARLHFLPDRADSLQHGERRTRYSGHREAYNWKDRYGLENIREHVHARVKILGRILSPRATYHSSPSPAAPPYASSHSHTAPNSLPSFHQHTFSPSQPVETPQHSH